MFVFVFLTYVYHRTFPKPDTGNGNGFNTTAINVKGIHSLQR